MVATGGSTVFVDLKGPVTYFLLNSELIFTIRMLKLSSLTSSLGNKRKIKIKKNVKFYSE